jgi:dTDP-glucose pyrophosphorylase
MRVIQFNKKLTFKKVLSYLDTTKVKCLIFANGKKLYGTMTDGDIRRGLIKEIKFKSNDVNIEKYINKKPYFIFYKKFKKLKIKKKIEIFSLKKKDNIDAIPIVDSNKNIMKVFTVDNYYKNKKKYEKKITTPVVIMAGGKGIRLKPFTNFFPKILMPYLNTVAGDHIIKKFKNYSFNNFFISINYKKDLIKSYFSKEKNVKFIEEKKFLGTIGSLSLIKKIQRDLICINCDTIININFNKIMDHHIKKNNDMTVVVAPRKFKIPYGQLDLNNKKKIISFIEKPSNTFLVNTGCYIMKKEILDYIPKNKKYDINDLLSDKRLKNKKIEAFPVSEESWIDIGSFESN